MRIIDKKLRQKLYSKGFGSLLEYCKEKKIDYNTARFVIAGLLDGSKSERVQKVKETLEKDFGKEIFRGI